MVLPVFLPPTILALGFIAIWGTAGYANSLLLWLHLPSHQWLYSSLAIIASHCYYNIPLAYLAIQLRLGASNDQLENAAQLLGANPFKQWWYITLPRLRSTLLGVSLLIFLYAFMSFALPLILGGSHYQTIEVYIYQLITQQHNLTAALSLAAVQWLVLTSIILIVYRHGSLFPTTQVRSSQSLKVRPIIIIIQLLAATMVLLPIVAVIRSGLDISQLSKLLESGFLVITTRTLIMAGGVAMIVTLIALIVVQSLPDYLQRGSLLLLALSPVTVGVMFKLVGSPSLLQLGLAYALLLLPVMILWLRALWLARPPQFNEALQLLGATTQQRWVANNRWLLPAILQSITFGIIMIIGDITLSLLLAPYDAPTMMSFSYRLLGSYRFPLAAAGMTSTLIVIMMVIGLGAWLQYYCTHSYATRRS